MFTITDRVSTRGNAIASVRPSVCPSVSTLNFWTKWPWPFVCVWVMTIALLWLTVKVRDQGQPSKVVRGRNAVGRTSILNQEQFSSFVNVHTLVSYHVAYTRVGACIPNRQVCAGDDISATFNDTVSTCYDVNFPKHATWSSQTCYSIS